MGSMRGRPVLWETVTEGTFVKEEAGEGEM